MPSTTWWFVTTSPLASTTTPEPSERWPRPWKPSGAPGPPGAALAAVAEKAAHELFHRGVLLAALDAGAIDVDDRGRGLLHHRRVGELDLLPALRHGAVLRLRAGGAEERGGKGGGEVQEAHAEGSGTAFADSKNDKRTRDAPV